MKVPEALPEFGKLYIILFTSVESIEPPFPPDDMKICDVTSVNLLVTSGIPPLPPIPCKYSVPLTWELPVFPPSAINPNADVLWPSLDSNPPAPTMISYFLFNSISTFSTKIYEPPPPPPQCETLPEPPPPPPIIKISIFVFNWNCKLYIVCVTLSLILLCLKIIYSVYW